MNCAVWSLYFLPCVFLDILAWCVQAAKALTKLRIRAVWSEPLLAAYARSTVLRCRGSNWMIILIAYNFKPLSLYTMNVMSATSGGGPFLVYGGWGLDWSVGLHSLLSIIKKG